MAHEEFRSQAEQMSEETWRNMRRAVELGRWPDGRRVSEEQRELCMQALIAWERRHLPEEQRTGFVARADCASGAGEQPVTLRHAESGNADA